MIPWPAADISAPESGNTVTGVVPIEDDICTVILGAGSALSPIMLYNYMCSPCCGCKRIALAERLELSLVCVCC